MARAGTAERSRPWAVPSYLLGRLPRAWLGDAGQAAVRCWNDNALGMAGMIAFFGFLSIVPLVLLLLAVGGDLLGGFLTAKDVQQLFHQAVPGLSKQQFLSMYWLPIKHSHVATTVLGFVSLLLGTVGLHDSVDWGVNRLWKSPNNRPFWMSKLRGLGVIVWATAFAILSLGLTWLWASALDLAHAPSLAAGLTALVPSLILDAAVFTALYKLTPTVDVKPGPAAAAGLVGAVLWELSKFFFAWWVLQVSTYNRVYGPLAASVIVMLWIWISAVIFLYGAALSATIQCRLADRNPAPESWWYDA